MEAKVAAEAASSWLKQAAAAEASEYAQRAAAGRR